MGNYLSKLYTNVFALQQKSCMSSFFFPSIFFSTRLKEMAQDKLELDPDIFLFPTAVMRNRTLLCAE